jgi:hypothetical protein
LKYRKKVAGAASATSANAHPFLNLRDELPRSRVAILRNLSRDRGLGIHPANQPARRLTSGCNRAAATILKSGIGGGGNNLRERSYKYLERNHKYIERIVHSYALQER